MHSLRVDIGQYAQFYSKNQRKTLDSFVKIDYKLEKTQNGFLVLTLKKTDGMIRHIKQRRYG